MAMYVNGSYHFKLTIDKPTKQAPSNRRLHLQVVLGSVPFKSRAQTYPACAHYLVHVYPDGARLLYTRMHIVGERSVT